MEINVMDENEVRHMYMQGYTVKQIGEIMYKQAQKRLKEEITKYTEWTIVNFKYWDEDTEKMTRFTYQRVGNEYRIVFETNNKEAYTHMEEEAQRFIDWWMNGRFEAIPVADKMEVAHGRWKYGVRAAVCSECGFERHLDHNFGRAIACPNCGARMEWGEKK